MVGCGIQPIIGTIFQKVICENMMPFETPIIIHQEGAFIISKLQKMSNGGSVGNSHIVWVFAGGGFGILTLLVTSGTFMIMSGNLLEVYSLSAEWSSICFTSTLRLATVWFLNLLNPVQTWFWTWGSGIRFSRIPEPEPLSRFRLMLRPNLNLRFEPQTPNNIQ